MHQKTKNIGLGAASGAAAGALATLVMGFATSAMYDRENRLARWREEQARGGKSAYEVAADGMAGLTGLDLSREQRGRAATAIHYSVGIISAALYGAIRRRIPGPAIARGAGFGALLWLVADEVANPLLGLTPGPAAFPWQAHARGLAGHLVFGLTAEGALLAADRALDGRLPSPAPSA